MSDVFCDIPLSEWVAEVSPHICGKLLSERAAQFEVGFLSVPLARKRWHFTQPPVSGSVLCLVFS